MGAIFYDFKRSLLRASTMTALLLFIISGIGLSYLISTSLSMSGTMVRFDGYASLDLSTGILNVQLYTYDTDLNPAKGTVNVTLILINNTRASFPGGTPSYFSLKSEVISIDGYKNFTIPLTTQELSTIKETTLAPALEVEMSTRVGTISVMSYFQQKDGILRWCSPCITFNRLNSNELIYGSGSFYAGNQSSKFFLILDIPSEGYSLYYTPTNTSSYPPTLDLSSAVLLGSVKPGFNEFTLNNSLSIWEFASLFLVGPNNATYYSYIPLIEYSPGAIERAVSSLAFSSTGIAIFAEFFPIVVLYIAYALIAKPRSMGALEFLLARPVTRWDLYYTRYIAGVLTVLTSSALFFIAFNIGNMILIGHTLGAEQLLIAFMGVAGSLTAFYSLCYFISAALSSRKYLAVTIFLYILFLVGFSIIASILAFELYGTSRSLFEMIQKLKYELDYFSPLGFTEFSSYYIMKSLNIAPEVASSVIKLPLVIASGILWIALPFYIGWLFFRKANLSS
jgi:ABC-2 type transport system permease protein